MAAKIWREASTFGVHGGAEAGGGEAVAMLSRPWWMQCGAAAAYRLAGCDGADASLFFSMDSSGSPSICFLPLAGSEIQGALLPLVLLHNSSPGQRLVNLLQGPHQQEKLRSLVSMAAPGGGDAA